MHNGKLSWRQARSLLSQAGGFPVRSKGSHEQWVMPSGTRHTLIINHLGESLSHGAQKSLQRVLAGQKK